MQTPSGDLVKLGNELIISERSREKELAENLKRQCSKVGLPPTVWPRWERL
jgi:hypothetical protein